jgi:hypothetical protein
VRRVAREKTENLFYRLQQTGFQFSSQPLLKFVTLHSERLINRFVFFAHSFSLARRQAKVAGISAEMLLR